ncbi:MAG: hypothetical protein M1831_005041 [Alyxoria varia]|nr:MAG: hypothetical protein M1831_005041 [Alyxoria varia]
MPHPISAFLRRIHSSSRTLKAKGSSKPSPRLSPSTPRPPPNSANFDNIASSFAARFAKRGAPTLLYQAPNSVSHQLFCLGTGAACAVYAVFHFQSDVLNANTDIWWMVPWMMGGVCVFMAGMSLWVVSGITRLARTVSAVPSRSARYGVLLRVEPRRFLFVQPKTVEVPLEDASLKTTIAQEKDMKSDILGESIKNPNLKKRSFREEYTFVVSEFRVVRDFFRNFFRRSLVLGRRMLAKDGIAKIYVDEKKFYVLDVLDGWLLDDGSPLDRMLKR